jgi:hypothetical protein
MRGKFHSSPQETPLLPQRRVAAEKEGKEKQRDAVKDIGLILEKKDINILDI